MPYDVKRGMQLKTKYSLWKLKLNVHNRNNIKQNRHIELCSREVGSRGNLGKMGHLTLIAFYGLFIYFVDTTKVYIFCKIVSSF